MIAEKPTLLIFTVNPVHNAPRVIREIECLRDHFHIVVTGDTKPLDASVAYLDTSKIKLSQLEYTLGKIYRIFTLGKVFMGIYPTTQRKIDSLLDRVRPDLVIVHPGAFLPYFFGKKKKFKLVFNAHEFHPKEFEGDLRWKNTWGQIYDSIYRNYLHKVDLLVNVCEGIAHECLNVYGKDSLVIPNAGPWRQGLEPNLKTSGKIRMIHHGVAIRERKLELMIELADRLGTKFELDMMLVYQDKAYHQKLQKLAAATKNVRLISAVSFDRIIPFIHQYDVGLFLLPPVNFNYLYALPNKFFEFVQARLAIAVGPSPEMGRLVEKYRLGIVSDDFTVDSMVEKLTTLSHQQINQFKCSSDHAAKVLNAERYQDSMLAEIQKLMN
ncbi:glycosyltransferase [Algoriphagus terrigena]|uniref:glycosyltransferase n=1 Tax=Algoriphagus terrigena TaxID=344884 RepID=UPI00041DC6C4|nr:glycosyltransferase [Algoriphagus terrigena]